MRQRFFRLWISIPVLLLLFSSFSYGQTNQAVFGRVVDQCGVTVPFARVLIVPAGNETAAIGAFVDEVADETGRFRYERPVEYFRSKNFVIYTTSPYPPNAKLTPNLFPPFGVKSLDNPQLSGIQIEVPKGKDIDLGDVPRQVTFREVVIAPRNSKGKPLFTKKEDWENIGIRIRDQNDRIVFEGGISPANVSEAIRAAGTELAFALPEGVWRIEVAPNGLQQKWPFRLKGKILKTTRFSVTSESPTLKIAALPAL